MEFFAAVKSRCGGAIGRGQGVGVFLENCDKLLVFLDRHYQVDVVVPRNEALVACGAKQRAVTDPIGKIVFFRKRIEDLENAMSN